MKFAKLYFYTFDISEKMVFSKHKKKTDIAIKEEEKRGTTKRLHNTSSDEKGVREHIHSFSQTKNHYCRKKSHRNYLSAELKLEKLSNLYINDEKEKSLNYVRKSSHKKFFYTEFNLGFLKRSKNRCDFCSMYDKQRRDEKRLQKASQNEVSSETFKRFDNMC